MQWQVFWFSEPNNISTLQGCVDILANVVSSAVLI